jgi:hypothetical protein
MSKEKIKIKILGPVGDINKEIEMDWPAEELERFISSNRIIVEGKDETVFCKYNKAQINKESITVDISFNNNTKATRVEVSTLPKQETRKSIHMLIDGLSALLGSCYHYEKDVDFNELITEAKERIDKEFKFFITGQKQKQQ